MFAFLSEVLLFMTGPCYLLMCVIFYEINNKNSNIR